MPRIDTKRGRDALAQRREPYWHKLSKGRYLGIRKLPSGRAAWIARYRDDEGGQRYSALGEVSEALGFDQATDAADPSETRRKRRKWEPVAHPIAATPLTKIRAPRLKQWHLDLVSAGLSKASANRTLTALKAALNLAVAHRTVSVAVAQEWTEVAPLKGAGRRHELFLDVAQRRKLLAKS